MGNTELRHWGIKGMKWGVRRYQNKDGTLTPAGKTRYAEAEDAEAQKRALEEGKKQAMNSGDVRKVAAYRHTMSNEELRRALERVDLEKRMNQLDSEMYKSGFDRTMSALDRVDKVRGGAEKLVNTYNLVAKINNTFNKKFQIPSIDGKMSEVADKAKEEFLSTASAKTVVENFSKLSYKDIKTIDERLGSQDRIRKAAEKEEEADKKKQQ